MKRNNDQSLSALLDLNGTRYVIDDELGLWVKFEVLAIKKSKEYPHGVRYSLTLHNSSNQRILGFDNAHAVAYGGKRHVAPKWTYDHWHYDENDRGRPYSYIDAGTLIEDFWKAVENKLTSIKGDSHEK